MVNWGNYPNLQNVKMKVILRIKNKPLKDWFILEEGGYFGHLQIFIIIFAGNKINTKI